MYRTQDGRGAITRRRLLQGAAFGALTLAPRHRLLAAQPSPNLIADRCDLTIGRVAVNLTGRPAVATGVNDAVPGPILRWRQGDTVTLNVTNRLDAPTSIHWHGIRAPARMDGVPALSFMGIQPGDTFTCRIPIHQHGTYWYHSHSMFQEQTGLYGAIVIEPRDGYAQPFDRDHVLLLSDWSDEDPDRIVANLKGRSDYYNWNQRTLGTFVSDARRRGLSGAVADRLDWGRMRMSPTDIADVTGAAYTYLLNGQPPDANWTGLFRPGERVRLRIINASSMTFFDVRIPGLTMRVVQADGNDVAPVAVDELRIGPAETYDVIVRPDMATACTIFAQSEDRTGFARGTLAPGAGMAGPVPPMDPRPLRTMADMGMGGMPAMDAMGVGGMDMTHEDMAGMDMRGMDMAGGNMAAAPAGDLRRGVNVDNVAMSPADRLSEPGDGLANNGRRVLRYADLRATRPGADPRPPSRDITLHLTGNMQRYIWGFDGRKFSQAEPIRLALNERVRFVLVNDTMMEHPIHLHGLWSELENGQGDHRPYKHTVIVKPGERLSYLVTADEPGLWAFHCHLLYHMEMGMFRTVVVS